jgi:hypothetical protein
MTHSEKQSWEQVRSRGRERFVLCEGILRQGLPFGGVVTVAQMPCGYFAHSTPTPIWELAVKFAFMTLAFGFCMGIFGWESRERDYQKPTEDDHVA